MKTYVKTIRWKRICDKENKAKEPSPCKECSVKDCNKGDCGKLQKWLGGVEEMSVEWEADYSSLKITRMICRTVVWFTLFSLLVLVACKWNGVIGGNTSATSSSVNCSCKEVGK